MESETETRIESSHENFHIPSIVNSIDPEEITNFQPVYERYYKSRYCTKFSTNSENIDTCIRTHTNGICVVYLSPKHSVLKEKQKIQNINFKISTKVDRSANTTKGKGKKGGQILKPDAVLCFIETEDNAKYAVHAGIGGKLLEINDELLTNPNLAAEDLLSDGFIAVILPNKKELEGDLKNLVERDDYFSK